jgi:hypothetical protein
MLPRPFIPVALFCLLAALPALAQDAATPGDKFVLPEKTEIKLTLDQDLKSGDDKVGETVHYLVERDVYLHSPRETLVIPAGTPAFGKVTKSSRRGMIGKSGKLEFTAEYILAAGGVHVPLRTAPTKAKGRNNTGASVAVAVLFAPVALLMNGRDIKIPKGQEIVTYVDQDTPLPEAKPLTHALAVPQEPLPSPTPPADIGSRGTSQTLFTLTDGSEFAGHIQSFDGTTYTVITSSGTRAVSAAAVSSMQALPTK